jgi:hypothetical protein
MWDKIKLYGKPIFQLVVGVFIIAIIGQAFSDRLNNHTPDALKEFKDGVQNHLVWDIKGQCFFVRPHSDVTVYLIRVSDCDRK